MSDDSSSVEPRPKFDLWLAGTVAIYFACNYVGVLMTFRGVIHPPWNLLAFFAFVGPSIFLVVVSAFQWKKSRAFSWAAYWTVFVVMFLAGWWNMCLLADGLASV